MGLSIPPQDIKIGDRTALARAITLAESTLNDDFIRVRNLLLELMPLTGRSIRLGVTGPPGAGKSTFIDALGMLLVAEGKKVAVLSVDPSSRRTRGSILGDKTRMAGLSRLPEAFIRPSPSAGQTGGVTAGTRESILLCEAAGYDFIIIETVGVGQSEIAVRDMVDCFLLLLIAGAGDELQGLKKGIMEMADLIVINKDDGENRNAVRRARAELSNVLRILDSDMGHPPELLTCSAINTTGITDVAQAINGFINRSRESGRWQQLRNEQQIIWLDELINRQLYRLFRTDGLLPERRAEAGKEIMEGKKNVFEAMDYILQKDQ
ncbi:MAG: methylmalonyl Co-A mutase-associated GTPase MeaB [Cyclobacteriaceae bacterium]